MNMFKLIHILIFCLFCYVFGDPVPRVGTSVETNLGLIRGIESEDGEFTQFLGIPYAVVDENQPFSPAVPHQGFEEAFDAYNGSVVCPQFSFDGFPIGQIQCLNLDIYVPKSASAQNLLPVMFYIHGGAFIFGSSSNDIGSPEYLLQKDVILVSINYRLGLYGFLCTDSPKAPGNVGLKDQLIALRWVKANIDAFGGDANKITAFGASAGAMSVHLHILSPYEQLFEGAILQSGSATSPLSFVELDSTIPLRISAALGFDTENVDEAIDFISSVDVNRAIAAANNIRSDTIYSSEPLTKPCVEKEFEGIERFVTANPNELKPDKAKDIPIIIGHTSQEMIFLHGNMEVQFFDNYAFEDLLSFGFRVDDSNEMPDLLRNFYIGDKSPGLDMINEITSYASDLAFNHPAERAIRNILDVEPKAVYYYVFSYEGDGDYLSPLQHEIEGVPHVSETLYLFKSPNLQNISAHTEFIDKLTTTWTNFAKYGNPTPESTGLLPVKWDPVTNNSRPYLNIDAEFTLESRPYQKRMAFWDLFYKYYAKNTLWYEEEDEDDSSSASSLLYRIDSRKLFIFSSILYLLY